VGINVLVIKFVVLKDLNLSLQSPKPNKMLYRASSLCIYIMGGGIINIFSLYIKQRRRKTKECLGQIISAQNAIIDLSKKYEWMLCSVLFVCG
jgi:hypothetical protein